jgi:hypothetical protein
MTILNETVLPNPFKQPGAELANVLVNIEAELGLADALVAFDQIEHRLDDWQDERLPTFLTPAFLRRLEAEIEAASAASAARKMQGQRIIARLRAQLKAFGR